MGKNQAYKAMQRARVGSSSAGPEDVDDGMVRPFSHYSISVQLHSFYFCGFIFWIFVLDFYLVVNYCWLNNFSAALAYG